ncbi:MAG: hypothetical protein WBN92_20680 [Terriglobia bacterium]
MADFTRNTILIICALVLLLAGCSTGSYLEKSLRDRVSDLQIHSKGDSHFVVTRNGNLAGSTVFSIEERQVQVEEFINKYKSDFGITSNDDLQFVRYGTEFDFEFADRVMAGLPLLQYINGLRILDREQLGVFDLESGTFKAAKISVADPSSLKGVSIPRNKDAIHSMAAKFLQAQGIVCTEMTIFDEPAYSLAAGLAGFEVRCTAQPNSQYLMRIRLLVNTDSGRVVFVSKEEIDIPK